MKMRKLIISVMCGIGVMLSFTGCGKDESKPSQASSEKEVIAQNSEGSTGYQEGEVEKEYVMVNDVLYCYQGKTEESIEQIESKGYASVGEISLCDNTKIPEKNLEAAHVEKGTVVYANEKEKEYIYLEIEDELFVFQKK